MEGRCWIELMIGQINIFGDSRGSERLSLLDGVHEQQVWNKVCYDKHIVLNTFIKFWIYQI